MPLDASQALTDPASAALSLPPAVNSARSGLQNAVASEQKELAPAVAKVKEIAAQPAPAAPDLQKPSTNAPKAEDFAQDSQAWIGALSALSALVGGRGRMAGTGALKAFAGGMKGIQEGNQKAFENALKSFKEHNDAIIEDNKVELDKFKAIMDNRNLSLAEAEAEMKAVAAQFGDPIMLGAQDYTQMMKLYDIRVQQGFKLQEHTDKMLEMAQREKDRLDQAMTPTITPEDAKMRAEKAIASGNDQDAYVGLPSPRYGGSGDRTLISETLTKLKQEKGITGQDTIIAQMRKKQLGTEATALGKQKEAVTAASNILSSSLPSLIDVAKKYQLGSSTDLNGVYDFVMKHAGSTEATNFSTQLRAVASDYAQLIGRGKTTVHSDEEALKILSPSIGVGGLEGFKDAVTAEEENLKAGIKKTEEELFGSGGAPAPSGGGEAPEGTVIHDAQGNTKVKKDGKWVEQ